MKLLLKLTNRLEQKTGFLMDSGGSSPPRGQGLFCLEMAWSPHVCLGSTQVPTTIQRQEINWIVQIVLPCCDELATSSGWPSPAAGSSPTPTPPWRWTNIHDCNLNNIYTVYIYCNHANKCEVYSLLRAGSKKNPSPVTVSELWMVFGLVQTCLPLMQPWKKKLLME